MIRLFYNDKIYTFMSPKEFWRPSSLQADFYHNDKIKPGRNQEEYQNNHRRLEIVQPIWERMQRAEVPLIFKGAEWKIVEIIPELFSVILQDSKGKELKMGVFSDYFNDQNLRIIEQQLIEREGEGAVKTQKLNHHF